MTMVPLSGQQYSIGTAGYELTVAGVGASIRRLTHRGRDLVVPFDSDELRPAYRGTILAPWPNRIVNGTYTVDGERRQLALTEPARGHALHGLTPWLDFGCLAHTASSLTLAAIIDPQAGYPHRLKITVRYTLNEDGLLTTVTGTNLSPGSAPFGTGPHPYLVAPGVLDDWILTLSAETMLEVTPDRLIPTHQAPTADGPFDYRTPRRIGPTKIDHPFTGLYRDPHGTDAVTVTDAEGRGAGMAWATDCPWVQIHTADLTPEQGTTRLGLAVEPMTCPPDAYNSGIDLRWLTTGQSTSASWHIYAIT